mmetsp:Transcript_23557/g.67461  ORF Transcript_23557/g.67461 Transcript_23557/m.67461 type:complete len:213 (+) Transcript_23557:86-724(+)
MKLSSVAFLSFTAFASADTITEVANTLAEEGVSACNVIRDEGQCHAAKDENGDSCEWCECQAVPPVCVTKDQANQLPAGVFKCSSGSPGLFQFVEDRSHHLKETLQGNSDICDASSKSISGYMDIKGSKYDENGEDKHLFFWMFEKRNQDENVSQEEIPFVVWLTGGPGCSSTLALLTENGPCSVNEDGKSTTTNPYSWTEAAHVLWLDQPL